jgi:hypothetical protein
LAVPPRERCSLRAAKKRRETEEMTRSAWYIGCREDEVGEAAILAGDRIDGLEAPVGANSTSITIAIAVGRSIRERVLRGAFFCICRAP